MEKGLVGIKQITRVRTEKVKKILKENKNVLEESLIVSGTGHDI